MRLYCPSCRTMYEEPDERFEASGGHLPCRVCMTAMVPQIPGSDFSPDAKTLVSDSPPPKKRGRPVMGGAAGGDVGYTGDGQKTTMLDARMMGELAGFGGGAPPNAGPSQSPAPPSQSPAPVYQAPHQGSHQAPEASPWTTPGLPQPTPAAPRGGSPAPSGGGSSSSFHQDPTVIFDMPRPSNPPPPMHAPSSHRESAPPSSSGGASPAPQAAPEGPKRGRVVIGGAAGSGGEALKTRAFDVRIIGDQTQQSKGLSEAQMASPPTAPSGPPPGFAPGGAGPVMVGQDFTAETTSPTRVSGRRRGLLIAALAVLVGGLVMGLLAMLGVFSSDTSTGRAAAGVAGVDTGPAPATRADRALRDLRGRGIDPPSVFAGLSPRQPGYAVAVAADERGVTGYWVGSEDGSSSLSSVDQVVSAIGTADAPVFALFDRHVALAEAVALLDALREEGKRPYLAAGSTMGENAHLAFAADAPADSPLHIALGERGLLVTHADWLEPREICFSSILPDQQLRELIEELASSQSALDIQVEFGPEVDLSRALTFAGIINHPELRLHLRLADADPTPAECR